MIRRLALGALWLVGIGTVWLASAAFLQAVPEHVHPELEVRIVEKAIGLLALGVTIFVSIVGWVQLRADRRADKAIEQAKTAAIQAGADADRRLEELEARLPTLIAAAIAPVLAQHNGDRYAHGAAAEHNHGPLHEQLKELGDRIEKSIQEHEQQCAMAARNPLDSPNTHRRVPCPECGHRDPSADDLRPLRGKG